MEREREREEGQEWVCQKRKWEGNALNDGVSRNHYDNNVHPLTQRAISFQIVHQLRANDCQNCGL